MRVLFIGNSHTFFNDMPQMLRLLGKERGHEIEVVQNTSGGRGLDWQSNQFDVRFNVLFGGWDVIVMQHIAHPFPGRENLLEAAAKLMPYVLRSGAKALFYHPWSEKTNPEGQAVINEAHDALKAAYPGSALAPVGLVWDKLRGELDLYYKDGEHAGPLGSYLIACTFLRALTGECVTGLPTTLEMGAPTFAGLTFEKTLSQDFDCPTAYELDAAACRRVQETVDAMVEKVF